MRVPSDAPPWLVEILDRMAENLESRIASSSLDANAMFLLSGETRMLRELKNEIDAVAGKEERNANLLKTGATERAGTN